MLAASVLGGCSHEHITLDSEKHTQSAMDDRARALESRQGGETIALSLEEALVRALEYNSDKRVAELEVLSQKKRILIEDLKIFPSLNASYGAQGRNNEPASSSRSILTGTQSLEPSVSTERHRMVGEVSASWNLIDVATAVTQSKIAKEQTIIARERLAKVEQTISRDVYSAYWRAYHAQKNAAQTQALIKAAQTKSKEIDKAQKSGLISRSLAAEKKQALVRTLGELQKAQTEFDANSLQLKSLLAFAPDTNLTLTSKPSGYIKKARKLLKRDQDSLELYALEHRPEMRQAVTQRNIALRETRQEILNTFPGFRLFGAHNWDDNEYLVNNHWMSFSATLLQNITALINAPARYGLAKNKEALEDERRIALSAAVLTQVNLARLQLGAALDLYEISQEQYKTAAFTAEAESLKNEAGFSAGIDTLSAKLEAQTQKLRSLQSEAQAHDAAASLNLSLGKTIEGSAS